MRLSFLSKVAACVTERDPLSGGEGSASVAGRKAEGHRASRYLDPCDAGSGRTEQRIHIYMRGWLVVWRAARKVMYDVSFHAALKAALKGTPDLLALHLAIS